MVKERKFRADLYYGLNVFPFSLTANVDHEPRARRRRGLCQATNAQIRVQHSLPAANYPLMIQFGDSVPVKSFIG
jgi:transcriptional regulator of acetoin/glycerol metabolism